MDDIKLTWTRGYLFKCRSMPWSTTILCYMLMIYYFKTAFHIQGKIKEQWWVKCIPRTIFCTLGIISNVQWSAKNETSFVGWWVRPQFCFAMLRWFFQHMI
jgi:hypothetical protein